MVNETGAVAIEPDVSIAAAGWTVGVEATAAWIDEHAGARATVFIDAPLLVLNSKKQRLCEKQVGQRYGRWKVSANSTNKDSSRLAGVRLRAMLETMGWRYDDGTTGPPSAGRTISECYPYTALVGAHELGYSDERPRYKRKPPRDADDLESVSRKGGCAEAVGSWMPGATRDRSRCSASARISGGDPAPRDGRSWRDRLRETGS